LGRVSYRCGAAMRVIDDLKSVEAPVAGCATALRHLKAFILNIPDAIASFFCLCSRGVVCVKRNVVAPSFNGGPTSSSSAGLKEVRARKKFKLHHHRDLLNFPITFFLYSSTTHIRSMSLEAPPPSRKVSSTPIALADASRMLDTYITNSESHPHLHPDALVTPTGVAFSSNGGPMGSVVMHNLRRVAAGLRGEFLEPEKTPEPEENEDGNADGVGAGKKFNKKRKGFTTVTDDDWEDKAVYEREEGLVEVGEVGDRTNFVQEGGEEPEVQVTGGAEEKGAKKRKKDGEASQGDAVLDKEARKKAKKERDLQRKRENEKKKAGKA
jgi:hypothetical protein